MPAKPGSRSEIKVEIDFPNWPGGRQSYRILIDGEEAGVVHSDEPPITVGVTPGRRAVMARSMHGVSKSPVLDVEVLENDSVPLLVGLNELGLGGEVYMVNDQPRLFVRRLDNDPGRRTP